jgi:hypothetical protein
VFVASVCVCVCVCLCVYTCMHVARQGVRKVGGDRECTCAYIRVYARHYTGKEFVASPPRPSHSHVPSLTDLGIDMIQKTFFSKHK